MRVIRPPPVDSPYKGQWRGVLIFFNLCLKYGTPNNRDAGDLRRHHVFFSTRRQAITWTNDGPVHWYIYAALGGGELINFISSTFIFLSSDVPSPVKSYSFLDGVWFASALINCELYCQYRKPGDVQINGVPALWILDTNNSPCQVYFEKKTLPRFICDGH